MTGIVTSAIAAYAVGCLPVAALVARVAPGRPWTPWASGAADFLKGLVGAALLAPSHPWGIAVSATAVATGHLWPAFGGAVPRQPLPAAAGAVGAITPIAVPLWGLLWALAYVGWGYVEAAAALATLLLPVAIGIVAGWPLALMAVPVCVAVLRQLRPAVRRALLGTEPRHRWRTGS